MKHTHPTLHSPPFHTFTKPLSRTCDVDDNMLIQRLVEEPKLKETSRYMSSPRFFEYFF